MRASGDDARRLWLCQGISRRTVSARSPNSSHRTHQSAIGDVFYRREGARSSEVLLIQRPTGDAVVISSGFVIRLLIEIHKKKRAGRFPRPAAVPASDPRCSVVVFGGDILAGIVRHERR